ncbi:YbhB/YbcL family Raf kinase inhibitor-like protein [Streptomyces sp. Li-HN-5-11]|uniref:YbhB/YbcL family Raf kinase inhibitor-like protein n=1 Tax=Streptomyces sp. Li-HN-5-11 TaxID=3075432 RepID=UPI0028AE8CD6|nr:YbhB/YbcL family Raf kinase inhibitor-like protein [Streptomyces sp. Li-HN-5-11]WNM34775.1 YbhB/YbcL family Raf kinase inhibitor-like protein [Streptomyces sp. Li-HN-5-11]
MKKSVRTVGALAGAAALVAAASAAATAESTAVHSRDAYGHSEVRSGIPAVAHTFSVTSPDIRNGGRIPASAWADSFGCTGGNQQIRLNWTGAPQNARSFAVSMQDTDATTGSGFWHWMTWDIPASQKNLDRTLPSGAVSGTNDGGTRGYLGPCPPTGDIAHHYKITVYALDVPSLHLAASSTPAVAAFTMSSHVVGYGRLAATAQQ